MKYFISILVIIAIVATITIRPLLGVGGWGPTNTVVATVIDKHVDYSGVEDERRSHYMVSTDKGAFEVDNGILLGIWNADDVYGRLRREHTYTLTTKGNKVVGFFMQEYPYIVRAEEVSTNNVERH